MLTTVINLTTGGEIIYHDIPPEKAVIFTALAMSGNNNTWTWEAEYEARKGSLIRGAHSVAYGDFCALREEK
jgi:hypothetical protein